MVVGKLPGGGSDSDMSAHQPVLGQAEGVFVHVNVHTLHPVLVALGIQLDDKVVVGDRHLDLAVGADGEVGAVGVVAEGGVTALDVLL